MQEVSIDNYADYRDHLEANPQEFAELFNTILINVTSFFRDRPAWSYLQDEVLPEIVDSEPELLRVWCAGCATGEEAYTTAMVLADTLGEDAFRERVKIYATDVDEVALNVARHAVYSSDAVKGVSAEHLERYFQVTDQGYAFRPDLRRSIIFGRNDIVQDAPISRVDLLVSRNALMYFTAEAQVRILERFNFALTERGFLFLGKSEMLITHTDLFTPHNLKWRVFKKVPRNQLRDRLTFVGGGIDVTPLGDGERYAELRGGAFALAENAQLLVSRSGFVVDVNQRARELFGVSPADVGRPFQDLELSYRLVDLRTAIEQAYESTEPITIRRVEASTAGGDVRVLDIEVRAVPGNHANQLGAAITFRDITAAAALADEHQERKRELEAAYEELQSTVEELETTNEELQSANEELETMNEELQSTNGELQTINVELRERSIELDRVNSFMESVLTSVRVGVAVVDPEGRVQIWNRRAEDMWGMRADEVVGQTLFALDIGLPVAELTGPLRRAMSGDADGEHVVTEALNRRGRTITCRVSVAPLWDGRQREGAVLLMEDVTESDVAT
jgi:two-component system CheB/CheR fusion protein